MWRVEENRTRCGICGITNYYYNMTKEYASNQYSSDLSPPGLVQLRHFDGTTYFWDIGDHLLLRDSKHEETNPEECGPNPEDNANFSSSRNAQEPRLGNRKIGYSKPATSSTAPTTVPLQDIVLSDAVSKQKFLSFYHGLSPDCLSGNVDPNPLQKWQDGGRVATLFEKKNSDRSNIRRTQAEACLNCGSLKEHKILWTEANKGLLHNFRRMGPSSWFWYIGSKVVIKEKNYDNRMGAEESSVNFVREHTTIPVPAWIRSWHEGSRALTLMERLPGTNCEDAFAELDEHKQYKQPVITKEERATIQQEVTGYVRQLRTLTSLQAGSADGRIFHNIPFWVHVAEAYWPLPPTHEEAKEDWFQKSLSGVSQEDIPELERLKENFPPSEPYTFTHGDLAWPNVLVHEKHVSGIIDWELSAFAPTWWEMLTCRFEITGLREPELPALDWHFSWLKMFIPNFERTLDLARGTARNIDPTDPLGEKEREKLKQKPVGPTLPPYPERMKDMRGPRHHMDDQGIWHERERLPPMLKLPEFEISRCYIQ